MLLFSSAASILPSCPAVSCTMASTSLDHQCGDSRSQTHRSRTNSGVSTTEGLLRSLTLVESPVDTFDATSYPSSRPQSSHGLASPAYISTVPPTLSTTLSTSASHPQSSFALISDLALDEDWFDTPQARTQGTPLLRIEPAPDHSEPAPSSSQSPSTSQPASMRCVSPTKHFAVVLLD